MKLFKNVKQLIMSGVIFIFDMDDTIFETPTFADMVKVGGDRIVDTNHTFSEYFIKVKSAFWDLLSKDVYFKRSGDFIVPINKATEKPFPDNIMDYFSNSDYKKMLLSQNGIIVLNSFPGFHKDPDTLGTNVNDPIYDEYEKANNKMIITGRGEEMRERIVSLFRFLGIPYPNYGLHLYKQTGKGNIEQFKIQTILHSIKKHDWDTVHFYEDRLDWLTAAEQAVKQVYPSVNFVSHFVTNVKHKRSL